MFIFGELKIPRLEDKSHLRMIPFARNDRWKGFASKEKAAARGRLDIASTHIISIGNGRLCHVLQLYIWRVLLMINPFV